jgi:hypothetical protein
MQYQIVVSRYNEDISYLFHLIDIIIVYNKGDDNINQNFNSIKLPNIGRESHTYLYHIIQNYNNLATKTLFIQGKINDHKLLPGIEYFKEDYFIGRKSKHNIELLKNNIFHKGKYLKDLKNGNLKSSKYTPYNWINKIGLDISNLEDFEMIWGANFCIHKDLILKKPKIFYENIIKYLKYDVNPEEGHFFERSWNLIFNHNIFNTKKIILSYSILNNDLLLSLEEKLNNILLNNNIDSIHIWSENNIKNNKYLIKYINNNNYNNIYPEINNNSFILNLNTNHNFNLLLYFDEKNIYEYIFNINNIELYDFYNDKIIKVYNKIINYINYNIKIVWNNENIFLYKNEEILIQTEILNLSILQEIKIKSDFDLFIDYKNMIKSNIYIFYGYNNNFYKDYYEDYYIQNIVEYLLDSY